MSVFRGASVGVTLTANKSKYSRELKQARAEMKAWETTVNRSVNRASSVMRGFAKVSALAVGAGLALGIREGVNELNDMQKATAQTTAGLKSTGNAAKTSVKQIEALSGAIMRKSGIDDQAIQSGANLLLTFTKVRNEVGAGNKVFDRATQAAVDLSVRGFGSVEGASKMLGKALNDPVKGISLLSRAGVTFSEQQKNTIKDLVATGNTLQAQKIILREVETQVGGSANAYGKTLAGQMAIAREQFAGLSAELVGRAVPAFTSLTRSLTDSLNKFDQWRGTAEGQRVLSQVGVFANRAASGIRLFGSALVGTARFLGRHKDLVLGAAAALGTFVVATKAAAIIGALTAGVNIALVSWKAYSAATKGATVGQWALNAALTANPVGLVVVGLSALVGGMVVAYRKSETFRSGVHRLWGGLKTLGGTMTSLASGAFVLLRRGAGLVAGRLYSDDDSIYKSLRRVVSLVTGTAADAIDRLKEAFADLKRKLASVVGPLKDVAKYLGPVAGFAGGAASKVAGIAGSIGDGWALPGRGGSLGGGRVGGVSSFDAMAWRAGLTMTSGLRPGDDGYHGIGRARDYSNSTGPPTPQMMAFAQFLAGSFGRNLKELIYTPLGYSIKNGQKVAPYAQAGHYNHVHVAYQQGTMGVVPGSGFGDKVPALLEPQEGVLNRNAVAALGGPSFVESANRTWPRFAKGRTPRKMPSTTSIRSGAARTAAIAADPERAYAAAQAVFNKLARDRVALEAKIAKTADKKAKKALQATLASLVGRQKEAAADLTAKLGSRTDARRGANEAARSAAEIAAQDAADQAERDRQAAADEAERVRLAAEAARQAELDAPRSMMTLTDAVRDLERAQAEATVTLEDDLAVAKAALADERTRQSAIQAVLNRGDLSDSERAEALGQFTASVRAVTGLESSISTLSSTIGTQAGGATLDDLLNQLKTATAALYAMGATEAGNVFSIANLTQTVQGGGVDMWELQTTAGLQGAVL